MLKLKSLLLIGITTTLINFVPNNAKADTCGDEVDCYSIGFTKTSSQCSGQSYLKCPFGDYYFCAEAQQNGVFWDCEGMNLFQNISNWSSLATDHTSTSLFRTSGLSGTPTKIARNTVLVGTDAFFNGCTGTSGYAYKADLSPYNDLTIEDNVTIASANLRVSGTLYIGGNVKLLGNVEATTLRVNDFNNASKITIGGNVNLTNLYVDRSTTNTVSTIDTFTVYLDLTNTEGASTFTVGNLQTSGETTLEGATAPYTGSWNYNLKICFNLGSVNAGNNRSLTIKVGNTTMSSSALISKLNQTISGNTSSGGAVIVTDANAYGCN